VDIIARGKELRRKANQLHTEIYDFLSQTGELITESSTPELLVDYGFLCKEIKDAGENIRKDAKRLEERAGLMVALHATKAAMSDPSTDPKVEGTLATGVTDVKMIPKLPNVGTPEYQQLMDALGVPADLIEMGVLKPRFEGISEHISIMISQGKPIPPGITKTWPRYTTHFRKRRSAEL
jgi:hypothetical protein